MYDQEGMDAFAGGRGGNTNADAADIFAQFFGGTDFFDIRQRKGEDTEISYDITLEDLYNGKSVRVNMEKQVMCNACSG